MHRVRVVVRGRVQGVGFRWYVSRSARALGLMGWVRNQADGGVEVEAEGPRAALERLLDALRTGPPGARVTDVLPSWERGEPRFRDFEIVRDH